MLRQHVLNLRQKAELLRTLAHSVRLAILEELSKGAKCVTDIQDLLDVSQPNISQHLKALRGDEIVDFYEDGNLRCYYITRPTLVEAMVALISREHRLVIRPAQEVRREGKRREGKRGSESFDRANNGRDMAPSLKRKQERKTKNAKQYNKISATRAAGRNPARRLHVRR